MMPMDFSPEQNSSLFFLQQLESTCKEGSSDASKLADAYRGLFLHLSNCSVLGTSSLLANEHRSKYEGIVDRMDELGLNNYAEGALALCRNHKNDSAKWDTTLSVDKILQLCDESDDSANEDEEDPKVTLRDPMKKTESTGQGGNVRGPKPLFKPTTQVLNPPLRSEDTISNQLSGSFDVTSHNSKQGKAFLQHHVQHPPTHPHPPHQQNSGSVLSGANHSGSRLPASEAHTAGCRGNLTEQRIHPSSSGGNNVFTNGGGNGAFSAGSHNNDRTQGFGPVWGGATDARTRSEADWEGVALSSHQNKPAGPNDRQVTRSVFGGSGYSNQMPQQGDGERLEVKPEKVGGPYANFGQKRKNPSTTAAQWSAKNSKSWGNSPNEEHEEMDNNNSRPTPFRTAREQYVINQHKKHGGPAQRDRSPSVYGAVKKSLGTRRGPASKFVPPILNKESDDKGGTRSGKDSRRGQGGGGGGMGEPEEPMDERLKGIDPKMIELINNEIMDHGAQITWEDIAGLEFAKKTIKEIVVWPMLRPDIFTGLRGPPKGLLLFGPPGTGKTLIGKCIASQSKSTFFCISASSLTSKWVGEGEKMVRALFAVARVEQPSVVFIDEIDSLLSQRSDSEHESSRRIKTEFLVQLDGAATGSEDRILVIGATNRPQEIDEAARRRFVKRLLIPLPESVARRQIVVNLMSQQRADLSEQDVNIICDRTDGYSGADMTNLCREAALGPIRSIPFEQMETITPDQVRPIILQDFEEALHQVRASVSSKDLLLYTEWNQTYGSFGQ